VISDGDLSFPMVVMSSLRLRSLWNGEFDFEYERHWLMRSKRLGGALPTTAAQPTV
jgi:hypothetical protein